jgi:hypothetical protein
MEITCNRCHQTVKADNTFCPFCGLPQLTYTAESSSGQGQAERWTAEAARDASMVDWKPAMRVAVLLAVPAGFLSSGLSPVGFFGLFWMAAAAAWAVILYVRGQRPGWITIGAGARIGLVTGFLSAWLAFTVGGGALFVERFLLHDGSQTDGLYNNYFVEPTQQAMQQSIAQMQPADAGRAQTMWAHLRAWMLSPWGHAGVWTLAFGLNSIFLLFFAAGGGALGARISARMRRPEV